MLSAGHEPTEGSALSEGRESTQGSAFSAGCTNSPKMVLSVRGTSPPKPTPGIVEEGARSPPLRKEVNAAISNGFGACQSHGVEVCQATAVVLRSRLWQAG